MKERQRWFNSVHSSAFDCSSSQCNSPVRLSIVQQHVPSHLRYCSIRWTNRTVTGVQWSASDDVECTIILLVKTYPEVQCTFTSASDWLRHWVVASTFILIERNWLGNNDPMVNPQQGSSLLTTSRSLAIASINNDVSAKRENCSSVSNSFLHRFIIISLLECSMQNLVFTWRRLFVHFERILRVTSASSQHRFLFSRCEDRMKDPVDHKYKMDQCDNQHTIDIRVSINSFISDLSSKIRMTNCQSILVQDFSIRLSSGHYVCWSSLQPKWFGDSWILNVLSIVQL
jgi:hypothetical protein